LNTTAFILASQLGRLLLAKQETITVAESCTGGLIASHITSIVGSSAWFRMSWVTYSNSAKTQLLGLDDKKILQQGAVSRYTAQHMAQHALKIARANWSIAVSGIAGPSCENRENQQDKTSIGSIWFAIASLQYTPLVFHRQLTGSRYQIRKQATKIALFELVSVLKNQ
jgi:nicotinamide-nucleotide amidase